MATVIANLLINGLSGVTVGGSGSTVKIFPTAPGASIGVASTKNGYVYIPGNGAVNGQRLGVRATGTFSTLGEVSPTITLGLYAYTFVGTVGTLVVTPVYSQALTGSGDAGNVAPWALTADIEGDGLLANPNLPFNAVSNTITGSGLVQLLSASSVMDGVSATGSAGLVSGLTNIGFNAPIPFGLAIGFTFSGTGSSQTATMLQFDLSQ